MGRSGVGVATGAGTRVDVTMKLSQLQNLCKRDPEGYKEDYDAQVRRLESECGILALSPSSDPSPRLVELIQFVAAVSSSSYKGPDADRIANLLIQLLLGSSSTTTSSLDTTNQEISMAMPTSALQLHRDVRKACVSALILMRNKGSVEPLRLLELFFRIMAVVPDKALRELLYRHMVNDIRNMNKKGKRQDQVNRSVQSFLHKVVSLDHHASTSLQQQQQQQQNSGSQGNNNNTGDDENATDIAAKRATDMVCELYRRAVWTDDRTVAILASAVTSRNTTVMSRAIRFFLNIEDKMADDKKREEEDEWNGINHIDYHPHSRKTHARQRQVAKQIKNRKKAQLKKETTEWMDMMEDKGVEVSKKLYPAIEMLRDPQGLAEAVFQRLRGAGSTKYEVKLLMMNFITRLVGNHELMLLPLYPYLQKYMGGGHQRDVTAILAYTVQACHDGVPPDEVYGILKTIAHNFITERCSGEQMAVGINAVRAICARVPTVLSVEESRESSGTTVMDIEAFARDLAAYSNHRDRSVSIAGKAWTNFIREVHPSLLQGKDRGMTGSALHRAGEKPLRYGQKKVSTGVEGADLLAEYEAKKAEHQRQQSKGDDDESDADNDGIQEERMNDEGDSDDDSGEWVDVDDGNDDDEEADDNSGEWVDMDDGNDDEEGDGSSDGEDEDSAAPDLVLLKNGEGQEDINAEGDDKDKETSTVLDLAKMTTQERDKLKQDISGTRVFTAADFEKMRRLVEREQKAKRDPREAARRKRAIAQGKGFEELSDDDDGSDSDDEIRIAGAVTPGDIMADAKRKRMSKAEKLEKVIAGRVKFENKEREGGSTNVEKKRAKNFLMSKFSWATRSKMGSKQTAVQANKRKQLPGSHEAKKRRRKV